MNILWFFKSNAPGAGARAPHELHFEFGGLRVVVWLAFVVIGIFLAWANWAKLDQVTRAPATVIASSRTQIIQSQDGGTISALMVHEGDTVEAGEVLLKFDPTRMEAGYLEARAKVSALTATVARLQAEVIGTPLVFPPQLAAYPEFKQNQTILFNKRQAAIREDIAALEEMIVFAEQELNMTRPLLATGDVSRTDVLRLQRQVVELKSQVSSKRNKYFQDSQAELSKTLEDLAGIEQNMAQRKSQLELTELRAPLKGVVKNVRITTVGGVIRPGEDVMQIVPLEDDLIVQAKVPPADIAFLKRGMDVRVKIDSYDYTVYGELAGKLTHISADTLTEDLRQGEQPYYRVLVRTTGRQFSGKPDEKLDIQPGMTASIEVKTGQRSVLQYMLKPMIKTMGQSLGER